ncbi:phage portal protein [Bacillus solitudinis]|uniref:phage portal protein n=1 Tax=Bacillus solitudinis TaxID=2014074 RepID=UPI000C236EC4|nr:phage portal protein [Bacillus solitudinis]
MFFGRTETELINEQITNQSTVTNEYIIKKLIEQHDTTEMQEGVRYYFNQNDILSREQYYWKDGQRIKDETKPNHRIPSGWHKLLVDQKVSYVAGNPVTITSDDKEFAKRLNEYFNEDFDDDLSELVKNASNKGVEYLHPFIDENGLFDYIIIPAEQVIPIYEGKRKQKLQAVVRYYYVNRDLDSNKQVIRAEWWDTKQVTYYIQGDTGEFVLDTFEDTNPESHFTYKKMGYGWERVPFIPFRNNEEEKSDLIFYKKLIDAYDRTRSDAQNNLEEIQSLIYVLKGYEGANLAEFMENLRYYKAIKVGEDGGVDTNTAELPIVTVKEILGLTEEDIIAFGMGVNPKQDAFGANPTGVALQFLYSLLDMKSSQLERKFTKALKQFVWFFTEHLSISESKQYNPETATFTFNNAMIFNETEQINNAVMSGGSPSEETALANHPWVTNVQDELKKKQQEIDRIDLDVEGDDDESTEEI